MKIRLFLVFLLVSIAFNIKAQQSEIVSFGEPVADLGTIIDDQGLVSHRFTFTNITSDSLQVEKVTTSCGCTSTNWSTDPIPAGEMGFILIQFDPYNRPGPFEKYAMVYYKKRADSSMLKIKGFVEPALGSIAEKYPVKMGALRTKEKFLDLGIITKKALYSQSFEVYNDGDQILVFADDMEGPNHITVTFEPYTLKPNSKGKIWVHYDVRAKNDLGFFREDIAIFTYEQGDARKDFYVTVTLLDIPAEITSKSPKVYFTKTEIDFGIKQQGDTVNVQFPIQNQGQSALRLKKVFGNCNCIRVNLEKDILSPGESTYISVRFLTHDRLGNQEKTVTIFTNDPQKPVAILTLKGRLRGPRN